MMYLGSPIEDYVAPPSRPAKAHPSTRAKLIRLLCRIRRSLSSEKANIGANYPQSLNKHGPAPGRWHGWPVLRDRARQRSPALTLGAGVTPANPRWVSHTIKFPLLFSATRAQCGARGARLF